MATSNLRGRLGFLGLLLVAAGATAVLSLKGGPLSTPVMATDSDSDGLSDSFESAYGTNVNASDTDGDSLSDPYEIYFSGTSPVNQDTDGDSVNDDTDSDPLGLAAYADGRTAITNSWSSNLTAPTLT